MKSLVHFLSDLRSLGVSLSLDGERLICNAPKGAVTAEIRQQLGERKQEILSFLREPAPAAAASEETSPSDLPLSRSQRRLWFFAQMHPEEPVYNVVLAARLTGTLNREAMEQSLYALVQRHESLRTSISARNGIPFARVLEGTAWKSVFIDLSRMAEEEADNEARSMARAEVRKPFDLAGDSLFRATLIRIQEQRHLLVLVVHHIIADGWSAGILSRELGLIYTALCAGPSPSLPPLPARFRDFVRWEAESSEQIAESRMPFWLEQLSSPLPRLELAPENRRPPVQSFAGKRSTLEIDADLAGQIRELGRSTGVTPFMFLLAAFNLLLYRYTGQTDILVGSATANRPRQEFESLVGFFVNTLVLRCRLEANPTFRELLQQVKETARAVFAHQEMPFDLLVEKLQPERALSHNPLVQVMFTVQNVPLNAVDLPGLTVKPLVLDPGIARADLSVEVWPEGNGYLCHFEFSTELFDPEFIASLQRHYLHVLREVTASPSLRANELALLSPEERHQMLVAWNHTASRSAPLPVHAAFDRCANAHPDAVALVCSNENVTYRELQRLSEGVASHLSRLGLPPHSVIAVYAPGNPLAMAGLLGVLRAGHVCLPLDEENRSAGGAASLREWLVRAGAAVLLTLRTPGDTSDAQAIPHFYLDDFVSADPEPAAAPVITPEDPAWVIFTAGSSGARKAVILPHRGVVHLADSLPLTTADVVLQSSPLSVSSSAWEIWAALLHGGRVVISANRFLPGEADRAVRTHGVTAMFLATAVFHAMVPEHLDSLRSLRQVVIGGELPSSYHVRVFLEELPHVQLIHAYNVAENSGLTCLHTITASSLDRGVVPTGGPVGDTQVFLLDGSGQPVPGGMAGELYVAGEGLALGYLQAGEEEAQRFVTLTFGELGSMRAFRTGDRARWRSDGILEWVGRVDQEICLRGNRLDPFPIEQALLSLPSVQSAVVLVRDEKIVAFLVPSPEGAPDLRVLPMELRILLPGHLIPEEFLLLPEVPRTAAGKVDYRALRALPPQPEEDSASGAPVTADDQQLAEYRAVLRSQQNAGARVRDSRHPDEHPLSRSQRRLWFLDQLDPGNPVYNIAIAMRLDGHLNQNAFESALRALIARHEALRTRFVQRDGAAWARVEDGAQWRLQCVDLSSPSGQSQMDEVTRLITEESSRTFLLEQAPLFRASLYRRSAQEHVLLLTMHHIVSDGWSIGILAREIAALYHAQLHNLAAPLPPLAQQYRDFVQWEQQQPSSEQDLAYWRGQLSGELPQLQLPTDRPRPPVQSFRGQRVTADLSPELEARLQQLARQHNATLFMVLLAAFNVFLGRYTRQDDLLIGTPTAGRLRSGFEGIVGFFVNNLVLRIDLKGESTFAELIRRVRTVALDAFEHQSTPFDQLVEMLQPERTLDRSPLFQVLFTLQNAPLPKAHLDELELAPFEFQGFRARYDLAVDIYPFEDRFRCDFEYSTDIFEEATVGQMLNHYLHLLNTVCDEASQPIHNLALLNPAERRQLIEDWNQTSTPPAPFSTVAAWFRAQARATPGAAALKMGDDALTYEQLDAASDRLAAALRSEGVGPGTIVGVYLQRSPEMVIGLLGILKARGAYLPIDPALPPQRIEFLLADAEVPLLLTERSLCDTLPVTTAALLLIEDAVQASASPVADEGRSDDLAYLLYTSGSTGNPKGTEIPQSALVNLLASMLREPGLTSQDTLLAITTLSFDIAGLEIFGPLLCGATLVLASREQTVNPEALARLLESSRASVMQATPSTWRMLIESGWMGPGGLRMWCGGEALPPELAESLLTRGSELWNLYGPTETTIWSAVHRVGRGENPILIGRPIANTRMYILDPEGQPVPTGVPGELYIGGDGVARGYWRRPELTQSRFLPDPFDPGGRRRMYRTGDLARYRRDGEIQLLGRTDHQIKLRGHRIEPGEIEAAIERHPDVRQAVVVVHGEEGGAQLVGYVRYGNSWGDIEQLRAWLQERLPEYMVPSLLIPLAEMPLTPNGKVDRKRLPAPRTAARDRSSGSVPARNLTERKLTELWSDLLRVERPGIRQNFFDLGGHSLLLVQLHARLRREFDPGIAIIDLFRYTTIESLAAFLDRRGWGAAQTVGAGAR